MNYMARGNIFYKYAILGLLAVIALDAEIRGGFKTVIVMVLVLMGIIGTFEPKNSST
jgi:uncharacterized membrane protein